MKNFLDLPPEIVLTTLGKLDYFDLHLSVRPTCTTLNNMVITSTSGILAKTLFIGKEPPVTPGSDEQIPLTPPQIFQQDVVQVIRNSDEDIQVVVTQETGTVTPGPALYCFEFHPLLFRMKINYRSMTPQQKGLAAKNIGFYNSATGKFISILDFPELCEQNALSAGVKASVYLPTQSNSRRPTPFVLSAGPRTENLTVGEYIDCFVTNLARWGTAHRDKGVKPLFYAYAMDETKRDNMPRELVEGKYVLRYWDDVFWDAEKEEGKHRYRDTRVVCAVQDERAWKEEE